MLPKVVVAIMKLGRQKLVTKLEKIDIKGNGKIGLYMQIVQELLHRQGNNNEFSSLFVLCALIKDALLLISDRENPEHRAFKFPISTF